MVGSTFSVPQPGFIADLRIRLMTSIFPGSHLITWSSSVDLVDLSHRKDGLEDITLFKKRHKDLWFSILLYFP